MSEDKYEQRILLLVSYEGTNYSGFAPQTNAPTVGTTVQEAIWDIDPEAGPITGSSRTDAGVHARNQPVSFVATKDLKTRGWVLALAQRLPSDISIVRASRVPLEFDPRKDPIWKRYRYRIFNSQTEDPFLSPFSWRVGEPLDLQLMRDEATSLVGEHDFAAFRSVDDMRTETVRQMHQVKVEEVADGQFRRFDIVVEGNRFMYNMVRIMAGTIVDVGRGRKQPGAAARAYESGNRRDLGMTAPAHGLHLEHVELRQWGQDPWPPSS